MYFAGYLSFEDEFEVEMNVEDDNTLTLKLITAPQHYYEFPEGATFEWDAQKSKWVYAEGEREDKYLWPPLWNDRSKDEFLRQVNKNAYSLDDAKLNGEFEALGNQAASKAKQLRSAIVKKGEEIDPAFCHAKAEEAQTIEEQVGWLLLTLWAREQ